MTFACAQMLPVVACKMAALTYTAGREYVPLSLSACNPCHDAPLAFLHVREHGFQA